MTADALCFCAVHFIDEALSSHREKHSCALDFRQARDYIHRMTNLLETILLFLGAGLIIVPVFNRMGLGSVLGYLLAGVLVGPHGFRLFTNVDKTMHLAEFGVIFLLFIIGLEIRPLKLWEMKKRLFTLGFYQIALCTLLISGALMMFMEISPAVALVIGFSLSLSSTAFALQTLNERNEFQTEYGQGAFSILLTQDIAAIPLLAFIPIIFSGDHASGTGSLWLFPVVLLGLILISRYLIRPLFRYLAASHSREIFTASALFIVLGVAAIMIKIGLSAALGTFIAGVLLAESEYRHELEANIDPFKGLLMGLFFISVGMGVSIELVTSRPVALLGSTLAYFLVKWGLIYLIGRLNKMNHLNSSKMGFSIAQGGEFAFVILGIVLQLNQVSNSSVQFLIAMITLSMLLGPFLEKFLSFAGRFRKDRDIEEPKYDLIRNEHPEVIIGGYGRFGQMFGRILKAQEIPFVAIDQDSNQVDLVRRFGNKVFFGDVTRIDLLQSAGATKAKYFVLAIDDVDTSLRAAEIIKRHFPHLTIFARARNRGHAFDLLEIGIKKIKRETFDSSINFAGELLVAMGFERERAKTVVEKFRIHDERMLLEQVKVRKDEKMFISLNAQGNAQLAEVLREESTKSYL
jgi:monovalent cation:proton antiporter-2 (CPA2) family protein